MYGVLQFCSDFPTLMPKQNLCYINKCFFIVYWSIYYCIYIFCNNFQQYCCEANRIIEVKILFVWLRCTKLGLHSSKRFYVTSIQKQNRFLYRDGINKSCSTLIREKIKSYIFSRDMYSLQMHFIQIALRKDDQKFHNTLPLSLDDTHKKKCFFSGQTTKVLPSLH